MTSRERFLAACHCHPVDRPPLWIMRQAGRYLPEYRALKEKYSFLTLAKTPELASEVTLQPLRRFPLDAAILFSDILVIPEALGQPYRFLDGKGIGMEYVIDSPETLNRLQPGRIRENLHYVSEALRILRQELAEDKALLGFGGSPWTLACYMVEGGKITHGDTIKAMAYEKPSMFHKLMEILTDSLIDYFKMQIESGADAIQIFDSWGNLAPANLYDDLSLKWISRIISALPPGTPVILFARGMATHAEALAQTGASVLSLDSTVHLSRIRRYAPGNFALQGNLDPALLNTSPAIVRSAAQKLLSEMKNDPGHIVNLGHGILPNAKIENVEALASTVTESPIPPQA